MLLKSYYQTPIGLLELAADEHALKSIYFVEEKSDSEETENSVLEQTRIQLDEYFAGKRKEFNLPLEPEGTDFQQKVWNKLKEIRYGFTSSYLTIARRLKDRNAVRAVGMANGKNPISIVIPCHRVIGSNGKLTGYAGGLWRKEWLLKHEGAILI